MTAIPFGGPPSFFFNNLESSSSTCVEAGGFKMESLHTTEERVQEDYRVPTLPVNG
jgi:hypothetical protein